jgi:hypothetical protein
MRESFKISRLVRSETNETAADVTARVGHAEPLSAQPGRRIMRMNSFSIRTLGVPLAAFTFGAVVLGAGEAASQQSAFVYVAKFVCGRAATAANAPSPVATGFYFTAINVHALQVTDYKKIMSVALPGEKVGKVSPSAGGTLKDNEAMEIDCPDIVKHLQFTPPVPPFVKGFVTIESARELDVVAVYTAAASPTTTVIALDVERVPKR